MLLFSIDCRKSSRLSIIFATCHLFSIIQLIFIDQEKQTSYEYDDTVEDAELLPLFAWSWIADDKNLPPVANTAVCHQGNRWQ